MNLKPRFSFILYSLSFILQSGLTINVGSSTIKEEMYRRPKFLEVLLEIRQEMAREADYDVDLFAEMVRGGNFSRSGSGFNLTEAKIENEPRGKKVKNREVQ